MTPDPVVGLVRKNALEVCSQAQFDLEMAAIDEVLRARSVPIPARALQAIQEICIRKQFSLALDEPLANEGRRGIRGCHNIAHQPRFLASGPVAQQYSRLRYARLAKEFAFYFKGLDVVAT